MNNNIVNIISAHIEGKKQGIPTIALNNMIAGIPLSMENKFPNS